MVNSYYGSFPSKFEMWFQPAIPAEFWADEVSNAVQRMIHICSLPSNSLAFLGTMVLFC